MEGDVWPAEELPGEPSVPVGACDTGAVTVMGLIPLIILLYLRFPLLTPSTAWLVSPRCYDFEISSAELIMPFSACTAEPFSPYARVAPIRSTISVRGLMSGYET